MTYHDPMDGEGDLQALAWQQAQDEPPCEHYESEPFDDSGDRYAKCLSCGEVLGPISEDEPIAETDKDGNPLFCPHGTHRDAPCSDCTVDKYGENRPL